MRVGGRERPKCESRCPGQSELRMLGTEPQEEHKGSRQSGRRETRCACGVWDAVEEGLRNPGGSPRPLTLLCASQVFGVHLNKWQLDRKLGCGCLFLYGVFLCFSIMTEFNVFTFVNLPMCGDH